MNTVAATEEPTAEPAAAGSRELCDAVEIEAQLHRLCRYNSLVSVRRAGDTRSHPSAVLLVQNLLHRAVIDALPDELSVPGTILQLRTRFDGAELLFCSTDRKSVVKGKRVSERVDHGGDRI